MIFPVQQVRYKQVYLSFCHINVICNLSALEICCISFQNLAFVPNNLVVLGIVLFKINPLEKLMKITLILYITSFIFIYKI